MNRKFDTTGEPKLVCRAHALDRRQFGLTILALAASAVHPRLSLADTDPGLVKRFTRDGGGNYGGKSWDDAMPIEWLSRSLAQAEPGSTYLIGFQPDKDDAVSFGGTRVVVLTSGTPERPIVIQAGSMGDKAATSLLAAPHTLFRSTNAWSIKSATDVRSVQPFFSIARGASNIRISGFRIDGTSADGFFKFSGKKDQPQTYSGVTISDIQAANVGRVIETQPGTTIDHLTVSNCSVQGIVRGFARFYSISNSTFSNLDLDANHFDGGGKNVCQIIAISEGENVTFENVTVKNAVNTLDAGARDKGAGYVQGDGIVTEAKTQNFTIRKCHAEGTGDAGFDLKTTNATIEDSTTQGCKFGVRLWSHSNNVIRRCTFRAPQSQGHTKGAGLQAIGTVDIYDSHMEVGADTSAIALERHRHDEPPHVRVFGGSMQLADGARIAAGQPGATLELHDVSVNGQTRNGTYAFSDSLPHVEL